MKPSELFSCRMCGQCCQGYGGTYVTEADIRAISRFTGEDPARFADRYCRPSGGRFLLGNVYRQHHEQFGGISGNGPAV